jgi:hypothetical protein
VRGDDHYVRQHPCRRIVRIHKSRAGRHHLKLILPPERHGEIKRIDSIKGQEVRVNEVRQSVTKSGKSIWVAWSNQMINSGAGTEKELLFVSNDVTEEVRQKNGCNVWWTNWQRRAELVSAKQAEGRHHRSNRWPGEHELKSARP